LRKRILAVDYGERRVGLALSDPACILATPLATLDTRLVSDPVEAIAERVQENDVGLLVIGYPLHLDGRVSEKAKAVECFAGRIRARLPNIKVELTDERYSSVEAKDLLRLRKPKKRGGKRSVDRFAAAILLQEYLDEHP
jgi:putative holliday junction resolvase